MQKRNRSAQNPFSKHSFWYNSIHSDALPFLQTTPPAYEIEKISTPIAVWSGGQDKFADPKDITKLLSRINNLYYHENFPFWGHLDFVWGLDAGEKMFRKIAELIRKYPWRFIQEVPSSSKALQDFYLAVEYRYRDWYRGLFLSFIVFHGFMGFWWRWVGRVRCVRKVRNMRMTTEYTIQKAAWVSLEYFNSYRADFATNKLLSPLYVNIIYSTWDRGVIMWKHKNWI